MSVSVSSFVPLASYNLTLYASSVLGSNFNNAQVTSVASYTDAVKTTTDIVNEHARMLQTGALPSGVSTDPTKLLYIIIQTSTGEKRALAIAWISTAVAVNTVSLNIVVTGATTDDETAIRTFLNSRNLSFTVS